MGTITHAQVQELVRNLPETKLSHAFHFLRDLTDIDAESLSQVDFACLTPMEPGNSSPDERRQILAHQAELMKEYYEQSADDRTEWQAGDFSVGK